MSLKLNIIIGSTRPGRAAPVIARWVEEAARAHGRFDVELVDLAAFDLPLLDEAAHPRLQQYENELTKAWSRSVASADAYIFLTPEYDFFPSAALVNAIQLLMVEWGYKPAGIVSYGGISGGLRSAQVLRQLLSGMNVHVPGNLGSVPIPMYPQFIGEDGVFRPNEPMLQGMSSMLDELHKWAAALEQLRPSAN